MRCPEVLRIDDGSDVNAGTAQILSEEVQAGQIAFQQSKFLESFTNGGFLRGFAFFYLTFGNLKPFAAITGVGRSHEQKDYIATFVPVWQ